MSTDRPLRFLTVANVSPDPNSGAAGTVYHTNVALRALGHEVDEIWEEQLGPRRIKHGNLHSLLEQPRAYRRAVLRAVARNSYDVVMMSQPQAFLAANALKRSKFPGVVINRSHGVELRVNSVLPEWHRRLGVPESRFPRSLLTPVLRRLLERQWHAAARWSDGVVVPSNEDRTFLVRALTVDPSRVCTVHHGVAPEFAETPIRTLDRERSRRILYVGQYSFIKAPLLLTRILNSLLPQIPDATVTWVTSAFAHREIVAQLDPAVARRVRLQRWMSQRDLLNIYDEHGLFVFPSLFEGAAKAVLEAMCRGLFVVASDTGGMQDYIEPGISGALCPVGDVDAFVHTLRSAAAEPLATNTAAQKGRERAALKTWRTCAEALVSFARQLSRQPTPEIAITLVSQK